MKKLLILLGFCCAMLHAGDIILMQKVLSRYVVGSRPSSHELAPDGTSLVLKGKADYEQYKYLIAKVQIDPIVLNGKTLTLEVKYGNYVESDNFYVKGMDKDGKVVASFRVTSNLSGGWCKIVCTPGKSGGGVTSSTSDVNGNISSEIVALQFYCGRRGPAVDFDVEIRNITLEDSMDYSAVEMTPMTAPGDVTMLRVTNVAIPAARATGTLADGTVALNGEVKYQKRYDYLVARIYVRPFILDGNALALRVTALNFVQGDSFYVKCLDKDGKNIATFYTRRDLTGGVTLVCVPGRNNDGMLFSNREAKVPLNTPVYSLQIYCGRPGPGPKEPIEIKIEDVKVTEKPAGPTTAGFFNHGVGITASELRHFVACRDRNGKRLIVAGMSDMGPDYILVTDVDSGKTEQYYSGGSGATYGAVVTSTGKVVYSIAGTAYIFDLNTRTWLKGGSCVYAGLVAVEGNNGEVYIGGAQRSRVTRVDPETGATVDLGSFDEKEDYASALAVDKEGFIYCGIGTARANIVVMDPSTGEKTQLLPEELRAVGSGSVTTGEDGYVYIEFGSFAAKCLGGRIVERGVRCPARRRTQSVKYQRRQRYFGDGSQVESYDADRREIKIKERDGSERVIKFNYTAGGLHLTSMTLGPDGNVYFSSSHPNHLGRLDTATGQITDLGYNHRIGGGNWCNMTAYDGKVYGGIYGGGQIWAFDPAQPACYDVARPRRFGMDYADLLLCGTAVNGRWRELSNPAVLLGIAGEGEHRFTLDLPVPNPGKWYINMQFFHTEVYGTVTVSAGGRELVTDTFSLIRKPGRMIAFGPFDIDSDKFSVTFSVKKSSHEKSKLFFALNGIELAAAPAADLPEDQDRANPQLLAAWNDLVHRPRTIAVHPSNGEVVIAGFANYGMVGGGFGVYNTRTGQHRSVSNLPAGESCIDMVFLTDGNLLGSTSVEAPGGGHETASAASVFLMDWQQEKIIGKVTLDGVRNIFGVRKFGNYIYAVADNRKLYRIDPEKWVVTDIFDSEYDVVRRNPLVITPDGSRMFWLQGRIISEIPSDGSKPREIALAPFVVSAGAAVTGGKLYFISGVNIAGWQIDAK